MLEGAYNFRDIGGAPAANGKTFRRGLVYRSGQLTQITDGDRCTLNWLGIRTVFDLRDAGDQVRDGQDLVGDDIEVVHAPTTLIEGDVWSHIHERFYMGECYIATLAPRAAYHADLFQQILGRIDYPIVIHCSAGKDRTGIVIAFLLRLAGVSDDDILADYLESKIRLADTFAEQRQALCELGVPGDKVDRVWGCVPENMIDFLVHLDATYGSVENYLVQGGMSVGEVERLRTLLVE